MVAVVLADGGSLGLEPLEALVVGLVPGVEPLVVGLVPGVEALVVGLVKFSVGLAGLEAQACLEVVATVDKATLQSDSAGWAHVG